MDGNSGEMSLFPREYVCGGVVVVAACSFNKWNYKKILDEDM
jgi:hypothetical protein